MLTERNIINFLIWGGGLILGPYLALTAMEGNFWPSLCAAIITFLIFCFVVVRDRLFIFPMLGAAVAGKLNFLPVAFSPSDIGMLVLVFYYVVTYGALQHRVIRTGPFVFFVPMLIITAIVLYHDHSFGLHVFGGNAGLQGSRPGIFILLATLTYLCGISLPAPSVSFMAKVPLYCLGVSIASSLPYTITTYLPDTAPYMWILTDNINITAYFNAETSRDEIVRASGEAGVGFTLMAILLAYIPINTWWRPTRWYALVLGLLCVWFVINGGYRSGTVVFGVMILVSAWCHVSWRALVLVPAIILLALALSIGQQNRVIDLPLSAQRGLSFLPGGWDESVVNSASSSNEFRDNIQRVYWDEYLLQSPLLGNGFAFDGNEFEKMAYMAAHHETTNGYYTSKQFITGKLFHIGWISVYDAVGLVGTVAFIALGVSMLWVLGRMTLGPGVDHQSPLFPLKVWMFSNLFITMFGYFTVFGNFNWVFQGWCFQAILVFFLWKLERSPHQEGVPPLRRKADDLPLRGEFVPA